MDEPGLAVDRHVSALSGLARINWLSASDRILWQAIKPYLSSNRVVRLLDIASGAGDVALRLWRRARRTNLRLEVVGAEISPTALAFAQNRAAEAGEAVTFVPLDALHDSWPTGFDIVTCSLFLHHLADDDAVNLLRKMREAAGSLALVNDLRRSSLGYSAAWLGTRMLTRSNVVHIDGPRSVAAAFTLDEVRQLAVRAGWTGATLGRRWPWRFLLEWRPPQ